MADESTQSSPQEALLRLVALGLLTGLLTALVVLAFRWTIESGQALFLPEGRVGDYESLAAWPRFLIPCAGGLLVGLLFQRLPPSVRSVGIAHAVERIHSPVHPGQLPLRNAVAQFVGGALAIISGQSVDREGPGVHLGAASGSIVSRTLTGPEEQHDTTLAACGVAASIAAAFNTPLAGVLFVIEVIRVDYAVSRFMPVILAAVVGAVASRIAYGDDPAFIVPALSLASLWELPYLVLVGGVIGVLVLLFVRVLQYVAWRTLEWPVWTAFAAAGLMTATCGLGAPQVLGISYDTLTAILHNGLTAGMLIAVAMLKLVATAVSVGLRVPGGLIGPTLIMGAATGAALGMLGQSLYAEPVSASGYYAMVGMVAMMGATLRAPLAALVGLLELTGNPHIILAAMVTAVPAYAVSRSALGRESVFAVLLTVQQAKEVARQLQQQEATAADGDSSKLPRA